MIPETDHGIIATAWFLVGISPVLLPIYALWNFFTAARPPEEP